MRKRKQKSNVIIVVISILLFVLIAVSVYLAIVMMIDKNSHEVFAHQSQSDINLLNGEIQGLTENIAAVTQERDVLLTEKAKLENQIEELKKSFEDNDERYKELTMELEELHGELTRKETSISRLQEDLKKFESVYSVDINAQFTILNQLTELLENPPPVEKKVEVINEDGETEIIIETEPANIAFYYEDITKNYKYSYNADQAFDSASLIKLPFALSILEKATEEYENNIPIEQRKYDLTKIYTYTKADHQSGSGKIINEPEDTEYTYLQLVEYLLLYSDNVAYHILKNEFGIDDFRTKIYDIGASSMYKTLANMSAADGGKILKEIHKFLQSESPYAETMYESMVNSAHTVMISYGVSPKKAAHKYGWDTGAYHDMGIVYDENPYVLVFLSNLEQGGETVNDYIQSIVKLIAKLHSSFYGK